MKAKPAELTRRMPDPILPPVVSQSFLLEKCDFFVDAQLWPLRSRFDPRGWLANFSDDEQRHACSLLNSFYFFSDRLIDEMFIAAFQSLSTTLFDEVVGFSSLHERWGNFVDTLLVTYVEGENPSITDSGYSFARRARQLLGVREEQVVTPTEALSHILTSPRSPVIFVDDFVATGSQFTSTWNRQRVISRLPLSFAKICQQYAYKVYYIPLVATQGGADRIARECEGSKVLPVHMVPSEYSALSPNSQVWPAELRPTAEEFLFKASLRAGIPGHRWKGIEDLALTISFAHCVPDATLPIFYWSENGWNPLVLRT